jgi:hypothetical protein
MGVADVDERGGLRGGLRGHGLRGHDTQSPISVAASGFVTALRAVTGVTRYRYGDIRYGDMIHIVVIIFLSLMGRNTEIMQCVSCPRTPP